jgi:cytoskeletal protein RodZ
MHERSQNFNAGEGESEDTLIAPRFDAEEARHAHPVVPLEETRPRTSFVNTRASFMNTPASFRSGFKRSWPLSLMVVALIAVGAVGGAVATKVLRRPNVSPTAQAPVETAPAQTTVPARTSDAPTQSNISSAATTSAAPVSTAPVSQEDMRMKRPSHTSRSVREQSHEGDADISVPAESVRGNDRDFKEEGEGRRDHGREREKRHGHDDNGGDGEKEMRKASKHAKGKSPRLVDVLTNP